MNRLLIIAGIFNVITALIHTIAGHYLLIVPFVNGAFEIPLKAILHSCWHMVTFMLFFSSFALLFIGINPKKFNTRQVSFVLGFSYIAFALIFVALSFAYGVFLFQWTLLLLVGVLAIYGGKKQRSLNTAQL